MEISADTVRRTLDKYSREEFLDRAYKVAFDYGANRGNCAQSTFGALQKVLGLPDGGALKAVFLLAGGLGTSTKSACGALAGGTAALSCIFGRTRQQFEDEEHTGQGADLARKLIARFEQEYGGITCAAVQEKVFGRVFDLPNSESFAEFLEVNSKLKKCPEVEGKACRWTAEIIWDELYG